MRKPQLREIITIDDVEYYVTEVSHDPYIELNGKHHYVITPNRIGGTDKDVLYVNTAQIKIPKYGVFKKDSFKWHGFDNSTEAVCQKEIHIGTDKLKFWLLGNCRCTIKDNQDGTFKVIPDNSKCCCAYLILTEQEFLEHFKPYIRSE